MDEFFKGLGQVVAGIVVLLVTLIIIMFGWKTSLELSTLQGQIEELQKSQLVLGDWVLDLHTEEGGFETEPEKPKRSLATPSKTSF